MERLDARAPKAVAPPAPALEVSDPERWNRLVDTMPGGFATQLWEWGEARRSMGWEPHRLVVGDRLDGDRPPRAALQLLVRRVPLLGWGIAYASRGPLGAREPGAVADLVPALAGWARGRRIATVVVDPAVDASAPLARSLHAPPWRGAPTVGENRVHVLDLSPGTDPWAGVRRKHREWIRRAERNGVEVAWADADSAAADAAIALERFEAVYERMVSRLRLPHHPVLIRELWDRLRPARRAHIVTATHQGAPVAAMLHLAYADELLWYAGGEADPTDRLGAGKLLVWRAIERAGELGLGRYHMWGTASDGLAHYKAGFGAREERYIGTRSASLQPVGDRLIRAIWAGQRVSRGVRNRVSDAVDARRAAARRADSTTGAAG